eukprot:SM000010S04188  [mRNA]  locus=s10:166006:167445:+ [translate_table: standard]
MSAMEQLVAGVIAQQLPGALAGLNGLPQPLLQQAAALSLLRQLRARQPQQPTAPPPPPQGFGHAELAQMLALQQPHAAQMPPAQLCEESAEPASATAAAPVTPSPVSAAVAPLPPAPQMSHHLDPLAEFSLGGEPENWCDALLCMDDAGLPDSSLLANLDQLGCGGGVGDWAPPRFFLQPEINEVSASASSGSSGKRVHCEAAWQPENSSQEDSSAPSASGPRPAKRVCVEQAQPTAAAAPAAAAVPAAAKFEAMPAAKLELLSPPSPAADVEAAALASPFEEDDNDNDIDNEGENEGESPPAPAVGLDGAKMSPVLEPAKPRQKRGTATDPQSLAARARRERISRKLRTLQTLVPNGNRLDTATMLDQAIEYVRFLQLQLRNKNSNHYAL